jgi:hypothetical protein
MGSERSGAYVEGSEVVSSTDYDEKLSRDVVDSREGKGITSNGCLYACSR